MNYNLPEQLLTLTTINNWICYKNEWNEQKQKNAKKPVNPITGRYALKTWNSYAVACEGMQKFNLDGLGFQLGALQGAAFDGVVIVGVDLDHVIENGVLSSAAARIVDELDSYTEYSPSGTGLHILCFASSEAVEGIKQGESSDRLLQLYTHDRYFTITGKPYGAERPIANRDNEIKALYAAHFRNHTQRTASPSPVVMPSTEWSNYISANLADMLQAISSADKDTWKGVGIALKSAGFDFDTFDAWSRKDYTPKKGETARIWKSWTRLNQPADAMKALYHMAHQGGWNPPREGMPKYDTATTGKALNWDGSIEGQERPSDGPSAKMNNNTPSATAPQEGRTAATVEGITAKPSPTTGGAAAPAVTSKPRQLVLLTADDIAEMNVDPVSIIIPGFLTEGTFVMGCYSGGGKTWLAMQLAKSVATGCDFLGVTPTRTGKVLFLEMELGISVIKERMTKVGITGKDIFFMHSDLKTPTGESALPGRDENLTEYLDNVNDQVGGGIALVVVDVWRNLKRPTPRGEEPDMPIYRQIGEINAFCNKHHAAVMILHHTRKASKESVFQETRSDGLSGSNALAGAMKGGVWMLQGKEDENRSLYVQLKAAAGSAEHPVRFSKASCMWSVDGSVLDRKKNEYLQDPVRRAIIDLLGRDNECNPTAQEISEKIEQLECTDKVITAADVGRRITAIKAQMAKIDRIEIQPRKGKAVKYYPVKRIIDHALTWEGKQEEIEV